MCKGKVRWKNKTTLLNIYNIYNIFFGIHK